MNILACLLAVLAVICFTVVFFGVTVRRDLIALGLALLTSAWIVQLVWETSHKITAG